MVSFKNHSWMSFSENVKSGRRLITYREGKRNIKHVSFGVARKEKENMIITVRNYAMTLAGQSINDISSDVSSRKKVNATEKQLRHIVGSDLCDDYKKRLSQNLYNATCCLAYLFNRRSIGKKF